MFAATGSDLDSRCRGLVSDLCFLDDRDEEGRAALDGLHRYGKLGVSGPFTTMFGREHRPIAEVASVFAELFHRLGYLTVDPATWTGARERFEAGDVHRSEVVAECGEPSLVIDKRVLCYAPADGSGWTFVDCWSEPVQAYMPDTGTYAVIATDDDPLVRAVRLPAERFEDGLVLTLYGRVLRWGTGWWLDHPAPNATDESRAIAAQLRRIRVEDPSQ
jgi:hypothetical protein